MKKYTYKKYIQTMMLAVAVIPFFSSCDYLDKEPDDMLTIDAVFDNADYTKQWLAGVYNLVPDPLWEYMNFAGYGYYMMSDETQMASSLGQFDTYTNYSRKKSVERDLSKCAFRTYFPGKSKRDSRPETNSRTSRTI